MIFRRTAVLLALMAFGFAASPAYAADKPGPERSVLLFDKLCYEMVPEFDRLQSIATENKWQEVTGAELQRYAPPVPAKLLKAWKFEDFAVPYQIAITHSDLDEQAKKDFPAFADAQSYSCSLILPAKAPRAELADAMQKLMQRKPDESFDQGRLKFDSWNGQNETTFVIINHMGVKSGGPGGLLSVTLMQKP